MLVIEPHPLLDAVAFHTHFPAALGALAPYSPASQAPFSADEKVRGAVRDLLRHGGYKPTGRGKPASEYLARVATESGVPRINAAVDVCNDVSLHSGLPISVIDTDKAVGPFRVGLAPKDTEYVFNASGQTIDVEGLLCLFDQTGPCANAVKDSQRTKTSPQTNQTLTIIWGTQALLGRTAQAFAWYRGLLEALGATVREVEKPR